MNTNNTTNSSSDSAQAAQTTQTHAFQAEVAQLLHLVTHSLYSNPEIFLRELVSNASDACDKLRFEAMEQPALWENQPDLAIRIDYDKDAKTLTISDNGIGMSEQEAIDNLGTIAKSGTREFLGHLDKDQQSHSQLIGQFGVGFYSGFIVADKMVVRSRRAGLAPEQGVEWSSSGTGDFSVTSITLPERGTQITLHLRDNAHPYLSHYKLKELVNKYSDHISLPIQMRKEEWVEGKDGKGGEMVRTDTWETVNHANALWTRPKKDITPEQYQDFYKQISYDHHDALAYTHNRVEGSTEYTQLLYIPAQAPFDLYNRNDKTGLKLYVKRVFIMEDAETLLPGYLRFIKGIVDANDLPLNVSRELLQESRDVRNIREGNTRRVLGLLEDLAKSDTATPTQEGDGSSAKDDKYATFYQAFGAVLKEGLAEDMSNQARIAELLRYRSSLSEGQNISLAQYVARMKEGQKAIYYLTADSELAAQNSPQLEVFKKKGIEVLFMTDRVDEWAMGYLNEYQGKPLQSVAKGAADLGDLQDEAEKKAVEEASNTYKPLLEKLKTALQEQVQDVRISNRLVDSPACLVVQDHGMSMQLERLLKQTGQKIPSSKPTMEINPHNALIQNLSTSSSSDFDALAHVLYDQALLAEGLMPSDPATFVKRINSLLLSAQSSALSSAQSPAAEKAS